jgi:hypothetical protein
MQKVYLDLGTNLGGGISQHIPLWGIDQTWKIIGFEPNPFTYAKLMEIKNTVKENEPLSWLNWPNTEIINAAAWINDGFIDFGCASYDFDSADLKNPKIIEFIVESGYEKKDQDSNRSKNYFAQNIDGASSVYFDSTSKFLSKKGNFIQKKIVYTEVIKTRCIDFSKYLSENFTNNEEIFCKMDIEQSEFKVLLRLIRKKSISKIKVLDVEWHNYSNKILRMQKIYLKFRIKLKGIQINEWI